MTAQGQTGLREAFGNIPLRKLTVAQLVSLFGDFLALYAVFSVVSFRLHASPAQVTGIMIAYMLPQAFAGPLAGVFVDRWNVKATMITSDLTRAVLVIFLIRATRLWEIYGVLIALSAISSFFMPAQTIAIRMIVPKEGLIAANALMMQVLQVTQIISPGIAGLLIRAVGEQSCYWIDSATFFFSAATVATILIRRPETSASKAVASLISELAAGVRFIFTHEVLAFVILSMAAGLFAVRCYSALIAVYVRDILHASTMLFGFLGTLVGLGMIAGTHIVGLLSRNRSKEHLIMSGLFGVALGILILAVFGNIPVTVLATLGMGFAVALVVIPAQALMQGRTPIEMLGRISSSLMSLLSIAQVSGLVLSGSVAQAIGIRNSYFATSALLALIATGGLLIVNRRAEAAAVAG